MFEEFKNDQKELDMAFNDDGKWEYVGCGAKIWAMACAMEEQA